MAGFWENMREQNDPQGQSLWSILAGYGGGRNPERETQRNIYSQGYLGEDISGGIREGRSPIGALLQGIGILGELSPRPATPYEKYLYAQGGQEKTKEGLSMSAAEFNLNNAKRARALTDFNALIQAEKLGLGAPQSLFGDLPADELEAGQSYGNIAAEERRNKLESQRVRDEYMRQLTEIARTGGKGKQTNIADEIKKIYANNKDLVDMIRVMTTGGGKDPNARGLPYKALADLSGKEKDARLNRLKDLRKMLEQRLSNQGIAPEGIGFIANALGSEEMNPYEQVLGMQPMEPSSEIDPRAGLLDSMIGRKSGMLPNTGIMAFPGMQVK